MRITFVNVGYGDAILMESDTGYTALLDGGGNLPQEKYDPKTDHKIYDPKALTVFAAPNICEPDRSIILMRC